MGKQAALRAGELNWRETRFVEYYVSKGNATWAYVEAGYSPVDANNGASRLLQRPRVRIAIEAEKERQLNMLKFSREDALRILVGIVTASLDDFEDVQKNFGDKENYKALGYKRYALQSAEHTKEGVRIKLHDKREALNDLWEKLGLGETGGKGNWFDGLDGLMQLVRDVKAKKR